MVGIVLDSSIALSWCLPDEDTIDPIQREVAERGALRLSTDVSRWPTHY